MLRRPAAVAVIMALAVAGSAGCANMTHNQKQGLAVLGGAMVVTGSVVMIDGWSCDESNWHNASCEHDSAELTKGGGVFLAGGALLTYALLQLAGDAPEPPAETTRTAAAKQAK